MRKYYQIPLIILISAIVILAASVTNAQVWYTCDTVAGDRFNGTIIEQGAFPNPGGVGVGYVILKAGEEMTFTVTQVSGGPTRVNFEMPAAVVIQTGIVPVTFTFLAEKDGTYDFTVAAATDSTGRARVNWSCGVSQGRHGDGCIHDGRINLCDLGALAVIYPQEMQIDVYAVHPETSQGGFAIRVLVNDLPPIDEVLSEPLLLGEATSPFDGRSLALYLLPSNEFVVAAENPDGTPYRFIWPRTP